MPRHNESRLQQSCVKWFDMQYPKLRLSLFAIPNGGRRGKLEAGIMKGEGVRAGVADMFLAVAKQPYIQEGKCYNLSKLCHANGLFIEFKYGKGKQSESQKQFQKSVEEKGYMYQVVSDFDSFKNLIEIYLD